MSLAECQPQQPLERAAFYVDGFNLYHALRDLGEPHLRWLNLCKLAQLLIPSATSTLAAVVYCSAYYPGDSQKKFRHDQYLNALRAVGVQTHLGHFIHEPMTCWNCSGGWDAPTEKEGDLNVALHLLNDAWRGVYDHAYLISADSDQAATARVFRAQFPDKKFTTVSPPGRNFSLEINKLATGRIAINRDHVERCLFPDIVFDPTGGKHGRRPREWSPPVGWVAPA